MGGISREAAVDAWQLHAACSFVNKLQCPQWKRRTANRYFKRFSRAHRMRFSSKIWWEMYSTAILPPQRYMEPLVKNSSERMLRNWYRRTGAAISYRWRRKHQVNSKVGVSPPMGRRFRSRFAPAGFNTSASLRFS